MIVEQQLKHMLDFTKTHEKYSESDIYQREVECLARQFSNCLLPLREGDLLAGRIIELPIGFSPQSNGSVGYYCNTSRILEITKTPGLSEEQLNEFRYLCQYWQDRTTISRIKASYSERMLTELSHGDFNTEKGIGYPLYRMSGAQMNPTKLLDRGILGLIEDIRAKKEYPTPFFKGLVGILELLQTICLNYSQQFSDDAKKCKDLNRRAELTDMSKGFLKMSRSKPTSFWEATQLSYLFLTLSGTINYGRLDEYLGSFYVSDLKAGKISEEFGLKIIKNMQELNKQSSADLKSRGLNNDKIDRFVR